MYNCSISDSVSFPYFDNKRFNKHPSFRYQVKQTDIILAPNQPPRHRYDMVQINEEEEEEDIEIPQHYQHGVKQREVEFEEEEEEDEEENIWFLEYPKAAEEHFPDKSDDDDETNKEQQSDDQDSWISEGERESSEREDMDEEEELQQLLDTKELGWGPRDQHQPDL